MIYEGLRIKTPSSNFIRKYKDYDGNDYFSFLYNYSVKNKDTGEYEVAERYVINIYNIEPKSDCEVICTKIVKCKPQVMTAKDGKEYLNCVVFIQADNVEKPKLSTYADNPNAKNKQQPNFNQPPQQPKPSYNNQPNNQSPYGIDISDEDLPF